MLFVFFSHLFIFFSCYFDGVKGNIANLFFTTVPLLLILFMNIILYLLTWYRIHQQTVEVRESLGKMSASMRASHRAARAMSMFVAAFFVQWWAMALFGIWGLVTPNVPQPIFHFVTTFSNIGGILNLVVYVLIKRRQLGKGEQLSTEKKSWDSEAKRTFHHSGVTTVDHVSMSDITNHSVCESPVQNEENI